MKCGLQALAQVSECLEDASGGLVVIELVQCFCGREHIRSVIVLTPLFPSRRSVLVSAAMLSSFGVTEVAGSEHAVPEPARHPERGRRVA